MIPSDYVIFLTIYCLIAHSQGQQYYLPQGVQSRFSPSVNFPPPTTNTFHQSGANTFSTFGQPSSVFQSNNNRFQPSANDFSSPSSYQTHNTAFQPGVNLYEHNSAVNHPSYLSPASTYQFQPRIEDFFQRNNDYQRSGNTFTFGPPSPPPASLVDQFGSGRRPISETPGPSTYRPRTRPTVAAPTTFRPTFRPIGSYSSLQVTTHRPPHKTRLQGIEPTTWAPRNPVLLISKKQETDKTFTRQTILEKTTEASISDQDEEEYDYGKENLDNQESNEKRENEEDYPSESQEEFKSSKILHTVGQKINSTKKQDNLRDRNQNLNSETASPNHHIKSETSENQEYVKTERSFEEPDDEVNYSSERTENIDSHEDQDIYGEDEEEEEEEEEHENTSDLAINHLNNGNNLPKSNNEDVEENLTIPLTKVKKDSGKTESQMPPPAETSDEEEVTDSWLIVASVQTSRSVGEARYLPAGLVQQKEIPKMSLKEVNSSVNSNNNEEPKNIEKEDSSGANNKDESINEQNLNNTTTESPSSISIIKANLTTATESLNDHLDWVQSQLSSAFLNGGFNGRPAGPGEMPDILPRDPTTKSGFTISTPPTVQPDKIAKLLSSAANDDLSGLLPNGFKPRRRRPSAEGRAVGHSDRNTIHVRDPTTITTPKVTESPNINNKNFSFDDLLQNIGEKSNLQIDNIQVNSSLLPQDSTKGNSSFQIIEAPIPTHLLPSGYKTDNSSKNATTNIRTTSKIHLPNLFPKRTFSQRTKASNPSTTTTSSLPIEIKLRNASLNIRPAEIPSSLLPPGFKANKSLANNQPTDILSSLLPPGYKRSNSLKSDTLDSSKIKINDIPLLVPSNHSKVLSIPVPSSQIPPGFKVVNNSLKITQLPSSLLPPGFKLDSTENLQADQPSIEEILSRIKSSNVPNSLLPKGFNESTISKEVPLLPSGINSTLSIPPAQIPKGLLPPGFVDSTSISTLTTSKPRVVFPNRPGGGTRKPLLKSNAVTSKSNIDGPTPPKLTISKGWPTRATTEFTGWPSPPPPPTTPMPKTSSTSTTTESPTTLPSTTSPAPSTTPPPPPISTTPGVCRELCELAGTIRLTSGAEWRPELLDHNTIEWRELADQLSEELQEAYTRSLFGPWVKKIRIDSFSQGSILVDFFVELQVPTDGVDTLELRRLFHDALGEVKPPENESLTSLEEPSALPEPQRLKLGQFELDPLYTDFIVEPPTPPPIDPDLDGEPWLPQWAIAGVVVGLASLLFVSIFGVTVLVSRRRRTKQPPPLTEAMLHEMSKNAGVGYENAALAPPGSTEEYDPWATTDRPLRKTRRPSATLAADSNLYDSWRSEWNGYYYDAYYGVGGGGSGGGGGSAGGRRRSDYDTNF